MRKFDPSLIQFHYVYITKITTASLLVVSDREGGDYALNKAPRTNHNGRLVRKIKIHPRVASGYFLYNDLKEFSEPRLAAMLVYDGEILSIELQRWDLKAGSMAKASEWKSYSERCMSRLVRITSGKTAWLNGSEVFFDSLDADGKPYSPMRLDKTNAFEMVYVDYLSMSRLGVASFVRAENKLLRGLERVIGEDGNEVESDPVKSAESTGDRAGDALLDTDKEVLLVVRSGSVLRFTATDGSIAYSPVMKNDLKAGSKMVSEESRLRPLFSEHQQWRPNLHFVRKVGNVLGKLYGMAPLEFLDLPSIIEKTGEVCLFNVSDEDSSKICLDMPIQVSMAWLLGFIGSETRLNEMHTLNRLFRSLLKDSFTSATKLAKIEEVIETVKAKGVVPLVAYQTPSERMKARVEWTMPLSDEKIAV